MKKLNKRKIEWIVRKVERREQGVWTIARQQKITPSHARRVAKQYKNDKNPKLKKCGRKPRHITEELQKAGSKHIKIRIKHPQSNGRVGKAIEVIKKLWRELGSFNKAVKYCSYKKPHMSLTNGKFRTPYQALQGKQRKR